MGDGFVPIAAYLRGERSEEIPPAPSVPAADPSAEPAPECTEDADAETTAAIRDGALADARRFRATLADACDAAVTRVVHAVAADVLARELMLAPAAIAAIVRDAVASVGPVVRVRLHPREAGAIRLAGVDVVPDPEVRPGDAFVDVTDGTYDVSLGARLAAVLGAWAL